MMIQTSDNQVVILGKREDGTSDGELEIKVVGGIKYKFPFYVQTNEDINPPRKETP